MMILALDPGVETGIAVYGCKPSGLPVLHVCLTLKWGDAGRMVKDKILELRRTHHFHKAVVEKPPAGARAFPHRTAGQNAKVAAMIGRNVGQCDAKAESLAGFLEGLGVEVVRKEPEAGGTKKTITPIIWQSIFPEFRKRTSNHARDAALLARRIYNTDRFMRQVGKNSKVYDDFLAKDGNP